MAASCYGDGFLAAGTGKMEQLTDIFDDNLLQSALDLNLGFKLTTGQHPTSLLSLSTTQPR